MVKRWKGGYNIPLFHLELENSRLICLIFVLLVLIAYHSILSDVILPIDDDNLIKALKHKSSISLRHVLFPNAKHGLYYRPLTTLSYFLVDKCIFKLNPVLMHFCNVLIHIFNVCLIYFISSYIARLTDKRNFSVLPIISALIFAIHPICTESVCWISGRTDLLAGLCVFASFFFFLKFLLNRKGFNLLASVLFYVLGSLAKEVAVVLIVVLVIFYILPVKGSDFRDRSRGKVSSLLIIIMIALALLVYIVFRSLAYNSPDVRIFNTIKFVKTNPEYATMLIFRAVGFYMRKFFWPYPMNFTIIDVDPGHDLLGILVVMFSMYLLFFRRTYVSMLFVAGVIMLIPSLPIALGRIAWTPFAERYLYVPSAFFSISITFFVNDVLERFGKFKRHCKFALVMSVFSIMFITTVARTITWSSSFMLIQDSVRKEPQFLTTRLVFGSMLLDRGMYREAERQFLVARRLMFSLNYNEKADLGLAEVYYATGKLSKVMEIVEKVLEKKPNSKWASQLGLSSLRKQFYKTGDRHTLEKARNFYKKHGSKIKNPFIHYQMGKFFFKHGLCSDAGRAFKTALGLFPENSKYRTFTVKFLSKQCPFDGLKKEAGPEREGLSIPLCKFHYNPSFLIPMNLAGDSE